MTRYKRFKLVLVGCCACFLFLSACKETEEEAKEKESPKEVEPPQVESSISVAEFTCPQAGGEATKASTLSLKIRADKNEKVFFRIQEKEDGTKITPNSGIIAMKNGKGTLISKIGAGRTDSFRVTLTDSLDRSLTTDCTTGTNSG